MCCSFGTLCRVDRSIIRSNIYQPMTLIIFIQIIEINGQQNDIRELTNQDLYVHLFTISCVHTNL